MVSLRNPNLILIFDPNTEEIIWHQTGPWLRQHDPDFRDDGLISVLDNRGGDDAEDIFGGSRILLVDPVTRRTREAYPRNEENRFFTSSRGKHQNLANGNFLIAESNDGRVLEIAQDGGIVWSYVNRYDESSVAILQDALRYPETYLDASPNTCGRLAG